MPDFYVQSTLLRYHALMALQKSLLTAKRAVTDALAKDILKQMKYALTDKSLPVQRAASEVRNNYSWAHHADVKTGTYSYVFQSRWQPPVVE